MSNYNTCAIKEEREKNDYLPHILVIGGIGLTIYFSAFYAALFLIGPIMVYFGVKKWTAKKSYEEKLKIRMIEFNKSIEEDKIKLLEEKY